METFPKNKNDLIKKEEVIYSMKKRFLSIALAGALAATALVGCGKSDGGNKESKPSAGNDTKTEAKGSVYYLNFKPEQDKDYQQLLRNMKRKQVLRLQL